MWSDEVLVWLAYRHWNIVSITVSRMCWSCSGAGLRGGAAAPPPSPSKKRKKGVRRGHPEYLKCSKTVWRPGLRPGPRWGSLQRSPRPPSWWGGGWLPPPQPPPQEPHPRSRPYGPRISALRASFPPSPRQQILKTPLLCTCNI